MNDIKSRAQERFARLLHHRTQSVSEGTSFAPPIANASVYKVSGSPSSSAQYGRFDNPTWDALESQLGILEDAKVAAFPSGMAAINAALQVSLTPGGTLALPSDGYYTTRMIGNALTDQMNIRVTEIPTREMADFDYSDVDVVFVETPSNPGLDMCDLGDISNCAHQSGAIVITDNTTLTPFLQPTLDTGADVSICSDTKSISGHGDVVFGHVATRSDEIYKRLCDWRKLTGTIPGPFEAWLVYRGLETLDVRLDRMCASARHIAQRLSTAFPELAVRYPGLLGDPSHDVANRQTADYGFLIGLTFPAEEKAERFLNDCPFIAESTSFGTVHSSAERRARWGGDKVSDGFVRLSIGCEPVEILSAAIEASISDALRAT